MNSEIWLSWKIENVQKYRENLENMTKLEKLGKTYETRKKQVDKTMEKIGGQNHGLLSTHVFRNLVLLGSILLFYILLPVVPHKAVAEVSKIGNL